MGPNPMIGVSIRRLSEDTSHTQRTACDTEADSGAVFLHDKECKNYSQPSGARRETEGNLAVCTERTKTLMLTSKTVKEFISLAFKG